MAFFQFLPDSTLMRFSSFYRRPGEFDGCPAASDWLDRDQIKARAAEQRQMDETTGEPFLTYDRTSDRLGGTTNMFTVMSGCFTWLKMRFILHLLETHSVNQGDEVIKREPRTLHAFTLITHPSRRSVQSVTPRLQPLTPTHSTEKTLPGSTHLLNNLGGPCKNPHQAHCGWL